MKNRKWTVIFTHTYSFLKKKKNSCLCSKLVDAKMERLNVESLKIYKLYT